MTFPAELDVEFYASKHPDLQGMSEAQLEEHYVVFGRDEGRLASSAAVREGFVDLLKAEQSVLEIGPFANPVVTGRNVRYFDVLERADLVKRAKEIGHGYDPTKVPEIHYVSSHGDLGVIEDRFSAVISSHCIEHQPDLIHHLMQVSRILNEQGRYYLLIPDKRYCFDHFLAETNIAEILDAHNQERRFHSLRSVIEHRALITHNDCVRHWSNDHGTVGSYYPEKGPNGHQTVDITRLQNAVAEYERANGAYIDVHAWQFTPQSFKLIMSQLLELGLTDVKPVRVYNTVVNRNEFTAILERA